MPLRTMADTLTMPMSSVKLNCDEYGFKVGIKRIKCRLSGPGVTLWHRVLGGLEIRDPDRSSCGSFFLDI